MLNATRRSFLKGAAAVAAVSVVPVVAEAFPLPGTNTKLVNQSGIVYFHKLVAQVESELGADYLNRSEISYSTWRARAVFAKLRHMRMSNPAQQMTLVIMEEHSPVVFLKRRMMPNIDTGIPIGVMYVPDRIVLVDRHGKTTWIKDRTGQKVPVEL